MSQMIICPRCGASLPPTSAIGRGETASADGPDFPEEDVPAVPLLASGSNDDAFRFPPVATRAVAISPDPILGEFIPKPDGPPSPKSRDLFPAIDLAGPTLAARKAKPAAEVEGDELSEEEPAPGKAWSTVLLASYASATTLAIAWLLLTQRGREGRPVEPPPALDRRAHPGLQSALSRSIEPPKPLPADRIAVAGQVLKLGSLEVRPVDIRRQDVFLRRFDLAGRSDPSVGGKDAFVVRLRLQNTSKDLAFAPVDQAFVRERGGVVDSYVETASGSKIYPFPLAVESELSIVGQDFAALRPGESRTVSIASAPDVPGDDQGPFLWRIRLRTGLDRTESIGVRWSATTPAPSAAKK